MTSVSPLLKLAAMEIPENQRWIDHRLDHNRHVRPEFKEGVIGLINFATSHQESFERCQKLRCPCVKCRCKRYCYVDDVMVHLCEQGFMENYYYWTNHGEKRPPFPPVTLEDLYYGFLALLAYALCHFKHLCYILRYFRRLCYDYRYFRLLLCI